MAFFLRETVLKFHHFLRCLVSLYQVHTNKSPPSTSRCRRPSPAYFSTCPLQPSRHFVHKNVGTGKLMINFVSDKCFGLVIIGQTGSRICAPTSIIHRASLRGLSLIGGVISTLCVGNLRIANEEKSWTLPYEVSRVLYKTKIKTSVSSASFGRPALVTGRTWFATGFKLVSSQTKLPRTEDFLQLRTNTHRCMATKADVHWMFLKPWISP